MKIVFIYFFFFFSKLRINWVSLKHMLTNYKYKYNEHWLKCATYYNNFLQGYNILLIVTDNIR